MRPITDRFMEKVVMIPIAGCWIWMASMIESVGYGRFGMPGNTVDYAHRASWRIFRGPIPDGIYVCHHCDIGLCVNPYHLFLGTAKDNMQDASSKGRIVLPPSAAMLRAEQQPMSKLTNAQVQRVRELYVGGHRSQSSLARELDVHPSAISRAVRGVTYASVQ
jgi:hypothetical protein